MKNGMGGDTLMNGKKTWTAPVIGMIQLNSAQSGTAVNTDSKVVTRKS